MLMNVVNVVVMALTLYVMMALSVCDCNQIVNGSRWLGWKCM